VWKSKPLRGRHAYDLETPDVHKLASNAWLKVGELFPETAGFMTAFQDQVIGTNNYKKRVLKYSSNINDICRKFREKSETFQHITGACLALAQGDCTHLSQSRTGYQTCTVKGTTNAVLNI
jgi:hypothetical protein